jgi:hypothetical protein
MPSAIRLKSCDACKFARSISTDVPNLDASKGPEIMYQAQSDWVTVAPT